MLYECGFGSFNTKVFIFNYITNKKKVVINLFQKYRYHNKYINNYYRNIKIFNLHPILDLGHDNRLINFFKINNFFKKLLLKYTSIILGKNNYLYGDELEKFSDEIVHKKINKFMKKNINFYDKGILSIREPYLNLFNKKHHFKLKPNKKIKNLIKDKIKNTNMKNTVCFNLRSKEGKDNYTELRNGCNINKLHKTFKYLLRKKYKVILTGDFNSKKMKYDHKNLFFSDKFNIDKNLFDLYFQCTSKYHISQAGGGNIINMINKDKLLLIDFWPIGYFLPNSIIYYKKVFFNKKNISYKDIIKDDIEKNIKNKKKLSKYLVYYNDKMLKNDNLRFYSEDEYLDIVKKYLKNSKINKINQSINDIPHLDFIEKKFNFKIIN
tara:strand:- start:2168 stop:3307 length:1140 start_codon:yes stop_codon:yes gene_type:complete